MKRTQRGIILLFIIVLAAFAVVRMCSRSAEGEKVDFEPTVAVEEPADSAKTSVSGRSGRNKTQHDRRKPHEVKSQKKRQRRAAPVTTPSSPMDRPM